MAIDPSLFNERMQGTLSTLLGFRIVEASPDRVVAELTIRDDLRTVGGALHGGTLMALADTVGAAATIVNLPTGATTTTLESTPPLRNAPSGTSLMSRRRTEVIRRVSTSCRIFSGSRSRAARMSCGGWSGISQ